LLTTASYVKIKECPSCGWLFLDKSKNGKRRWCNMLTCGSNDKATRYYHRKKMLENRPGAKQDKEAGKDDLL
jgi:predicted RNA-binding Zn ribbon-like protein